MRLENYQVAPIGVIAIHAGYERGTGELAISLAKAMGGVPIYVDANPKHITSSRFSNLQIESFLGCVWALVSIHGCADRHLKESDEFVVVGGRNLSLKQSVLQALLQNDILATDLIENPRLLGMHPHNVCNRCLSGAGVQLELSLSLRNRILRSWQFRMHLAQILASAVKC